MEEIKRAPEYVVLHDNLGGMFVKGDMVPSGTFNDEQLARLVGLGAIEAVDPAGEDFKDRGELTGERAGTGEDGDTGTARLPDSPAAAAPQSAEEFKERQDAAALEAAGGDATDADDDDEKPSRRRK